MHCQPPQGAITLIELCAVCGVGHGSSHRTIYIVGVALRLRQVRRWMMHSVALGVK